MPQQVFGAEAVVSMVNRALANTSPANTVFQNQVATAGTTEASQYAFAAQIGAQYAVGKTPAQLSALLLTNMGVDNEILESALTDYIAFHGPQNIGVIALQLGQILAGLEGDATFGAAAAAWNQEVTNAYQYSSSPNNNTPQTGDDGANTTQLSRFTDVLTGHEFTGYLDYNQFTGADEQTLSTSDRLTGTDAEDDVLFAQLTNAGARPTLNGVEIVSIDAKGTAPTLDLSDANGVKTIINANSNENSNLTFSNLKNLVDVAIKNTNGNTVVGFNASVVAGVADALNLNVEGAGVAAKAANVTVQGIETLNITASGKASVLGTVSSDNVKALTIAGDQNLTVGTKVSLTAAQAALTAANNAKATADTNSANAATVQTNAAAVNTAIAGGTYTAAPTAAEIATVIAGVPALGLTATSPVVVAIAARIAATTPVDAAAAAAALNTAITAVTTQYATDVTTAANNVTTAQQAVNNAATSQGFTSANIETVDASAATGNLFLNLSSSAGRDQTVTTGTGNDVVVTGDLSAADTFNLGEGNDRLVLTTISTNQAAKLLGVEEVEARVAGTNLNLTNAADVKLLAVAENAGFANVTAVKSGTAVVFEGAGLKNAVSNAAVNFGGVTYNLANANGTTDVIDFKFNNGGVVLGANSNVAIGNLVNTGNNVETINLAFSDVVATNTVTVNNIDVGTSLKTLNVVADSKVTLNSVNDLIKLTLVDATGVKGAFTANFGALADTANATIKLGGSGVNNLTVSKAADPIAIPASADSHKVLTVDASAGTGNQKITIAGNADTDTNFTAITIDSGAKAAAAASVIVIGGSGNDTIDVTGANTLLTTNWIKGGAGADTIKLGASGAVDILVFAAGDSTSAAKDQITGFVANQDKIDLSSFGFDSNLWTAANFTVGGALNGTANEFNGLAVAVNGSTVYVDVNGDNKLDASDLVIEVAGITGAANEFLFV